MFVLAINTACKGQPTPGIKESTLGYYYRLDTINGHTFYYDSHCAFKDHDCKKCEERFVFLIDSIIDDRVVKLLCIENK